MGAMQQSMMMLGSGLPLQRTYTSGSAQTETAPAGAANVIIAVWGGSGGGSSGYVSGCIDRVGRGGGSGGYSETSVAISAGQTLTYTVGVGGSKGADFSPTTGGTAGTASSCSSGTKTITTLTGNGGTAGVNPSTNGAGGTASGGTAVNTTGNAGALGNGAAASVTGWNSNTGPAGGRGGNLAANDHTAGGDGKIIFYYT